jgi:indole-3-glycerol phosphate synthase
MILDDIVMSTRRRVANARRDLPLKYLLLRAEKPSRKGIEFINALASPTLSFICEVKKASPSKGVIAEDFPYLQIAQAYKNAGADAVSVLTEPDFFMGKDEHLREIAARVSIPILRKDFVIDEYQIYEAKALGAAAILLIVSLLDRSVLSTFIRTAHRIGLVPLVEAHTEDQVKCAVQAGARIVGINNRDLHTFKVDLSTTERLAKYIPDGVIIVAESGFQSPQDIAAVKDIADAVLIGESLLRASDKKAFLQDLRSLL